jgi:Tfp pilus assembly pilus retraction ATPase PilT
MITMNQSLSQLVKAKKLTKETGLAYSTKPEEFRKLFGISGGVGGGGGH